MLPQPPRSARIVFVLLLAVACQSSEGSGSTVTGVGGSSTGGHAGTSGSGGLLVGGTSGIGGSTAGSFSIGGSTSGSSGTGGSTAGGSGTGGSTAGSSGSSGSTADSSGSGGSTAGSSGSGGSTAGSSGSGGSTAGSSGSGGSTTDAAAAGGSGTGGSGTGGVATGGTGGTTFDAGQSSVGFSFADPSGIPTTKCQTFTNPFGNAVAIAEVQTTATPELVALWVNRIAGATNGALQDCVLDGNSITTTTIYFGQALSDLVRAPAGVAFPMAAGDGLLVGAVFRNSGASTVTSSVNVALRSAAPGYQPAGLAFLTAVQLSVPALTTATARNFSCPLQTTANLFGATGRVQLHGVSMTATLSGGTTLFQSNPWNSTTAAAALRAPPLAVTNTSSISLACVYTNNTTQTLSFGFDYAQNEQCSLFVYYYPTTGGPIGTFCN